MKHPLAFQPTRLGWWDKSCLVVARLSGGITIIPVGGRSGDDAGDNLLGESAEFFAPCCALSQCFEFGFFALEVDGDKRYCEDKQAEGRRATLWEYAMDVADSITGGRGGADEEEKEDEEAVAVYRLVYFQSTSPEELFQKKIDDEEYGEAVVMARHFGLDCDRVFVRQWRASDLSAVAAQDYLSKVEDVVTALRECAVTVPPTPESCRSLLSFGLTKAQAEVDCGRASSFLIAAQTCLAEFLDRLDLYLAVIDSEEDFDPQEYNSFRTSTLKDAATNLAYEGRSHRLKRFLMVAEVDDLTSHATGVLSSLPEPLDPMPELAEIMTRPAVGRATTASWFRRRAAQTVGLSGQSDYALALLHLAANLELDCGSGGSADPVFYHHLATYDALVFEKKDLSADFDKVQETDDKKLLEMLLARPRPNLTKVFKTLGLPFLDRVEQCASGSSVKLFREFVVETASRDFIAASDLLRVVAENLDETWFNAADLRAMGMEVVWNSSPNSDVQGLGSFLAYLQDYCRLEEERGGAEYLSLLEAVKTLGFVARYDRSATIAGIKEAQSSGAGDKAKAVVLRMLSAGRDKIKLKVRKPLMGCNTVMP